MTEVGAASPADYLGGDDVIETRHPEVASLAANLRASNPADESFAAAAFDWVRDQVAHTMDVQDRRVTLTASEVLRKRVGLCYAKSHLLAAVLRAEGIPAGLCYQRLEAAGGYVLHGLIAVYLNGRWHRQDPRGNKPGVDARFSLQEERLAYAADADAGEVDYPGIYVSPAACVVRALRGSADALSLCENGLPTGLDTSDAAVVG